MELGTPACTIVALSTGRNDITEATIKLTAPSGVDFNHDQASLVNEGMWHISQKTNDETHYLWLEDGELEAGKESFKVSKLSADKTVLISVPHSDASAFHAMVSLEPKSKPYSRLTNSPISE